MEQRRFPRWLQILGATGCLLLVTTLPGQAVAAGLAMFAVGAGYRAARLAISRF
jgi:APA family basic amino acid/polyamine antiporter